MTADTDELRELYLDVTGEEGVTESQAEEPSHSPIEEREATLEREVSSVARQDGLEDAIRGAEV
jgi:hypothetical protein